MCLHPQFLWGGGVCTIESSNKHTFIDVYRSCQTSLMMMSSWGPILPILMAYPIHNHSRGKKNLIHLTCQTFLMMMSSHMDPIHPMAYPNDRQKKSLMICYPCSCPTCLRKMKSREPMPSGQPTRQMKSRLTICQTFLILTIHQICQTFHWMMMRRVLPIHRLVLPTHRLPRYPIVLQ